MKRTLTSIVGLCAGFTLLASPALAGPEHQDHQNADKMGDKPTLADIVGEVKLPELFIGSKAPELQIAKFVKGDSVQSFDKGQVYVVEFWATWCGPCIAAFPHLSEEQAKYGEKVKFIGVNVWEGVDDQAERITKVENFVKDQGDRMSYTVAVENGSAMADTWMKPAGQNGIPAAFIVDATGHIAWVGHPMNIDESLDAVVSGKFDREAAIKEFKEQNQLMAGYSKFAQSMKSGKDIEEAMIIAEILVNDYFQDEPSGLNAIAWTILSSDNEAIGKKGQMLAFKASKQACEKTEWKDWMILDTYALAAHTVGKNTEAVKWQKKAIELLPAASAQAKPDLEAALKEYEAAAKDD